MFAALPGGLPEAHTLSFWSGPFDSLTTAADGSLRLDITADETESSSADRLELTPLTDTSLHVSITREDAGGVVATLWDQAAVRFSDELRRVRLHTYVLEGMTPPDDAGLSPVISPDDGTVIASGDGAGDGGQPRPPVTVVGSLGDAGIETDVAPQVDLPPPGPGGDDRWTDAELREALAALIGGAPAPNDPWPLHLLIVSRSDRPRVLGATYHFTDPGDMRASVLFYDSILDYPKVSGRPDAIAREYLFTTVHELGHQLRLPHAWEPFRGVGPPERASRALTFMNYPHLYVRGYRRFYNSFPFRFRREELDHLRHASWKDIWPGLADTNDGVDLLEHTESGDPRLGDQARRHPGLGLHLRTVGDARFRYTEPVHLELKLENVSRKRIRVPRDILDPDGGGLRISVSHRDSHSTPRAVLPIVERQERDGSRVLGVRGRPREPTYSLYRDVDLSFGRQGFTFEEPGKYRIEAVVELPNGRIASAAPIEVVIEAPDITERRHLEALRDSDLGRALVYGGDPSSSAMEWLRVVAEAGEPAWLASWAALRLGESLAHGFKRATEAPDTRPDPYSAAEWLRRADVIAFHDRPLPNLVRSDLFRLQAACFLGADRAEEAEKTLLRLREFVEATVQTNRRLRKHLIGEISRFRGRSPRASADQTQMEAEI
jgi:hypothetical protein